MTDSILSQSARQFSHTRTQLLVLWCLSLPSSAPRVEVRAIEMDFCRRVGGGGAMSFQFSSAPYPCFIQVTHLYLVNYGVLYG